MKMSIKNLKKLVKWYDVAIEYGDLDDEDMILYDRISEYLEERGVDVGMDYETVEEDSEDEDMFESLNDSMSYEMDDD